MTDEEFAKELSNLVEKGIANNIGIFKVIGMLETLKAGLVNHLLSEEKNVK